MIEAKNLTMIYGKDVKAVDDLSFSIGKGEIVGFAGPNGAGKTTVIKMLTGILKPTSGSASVNGFDILKEPLEAKRSFAYVSDDPDVLLQLSGMQYINFIADLYDVSDEDRQARVPDLAERFGMTDALDTPMREYSHGMRQKLMIIAALTHNPPAWILDEPMTGLDPSAAFELKQMMREHAAKGNCVLFSTHVLEVAEKLCDHILIMNHGCSLYQGTVEELSAQNPGKDLEEIFLELINYTPRTGGEKA
ncbi:MAG: ABC transporter ATP-binding protein [Lachnospiraceae bacterium]|nr:ABC transporter ATP-binding protein [Lachnospiraceae bacterium]